MSLSPPIDIDDQYYHEIIRELGYPLVEETDLEIGRADIENLCVLPAMREYFKWYPLKEEQSVSVAGNFSIDFPDQFTFGVVDARITGLPRGTGTTSNPFVNEVFYTNTRKGRYGTRNDYGMTAARIYERMEMRSAVDTTKAVKIRVDRKNQRVTGYASITGDLNIVWAKWDNEFGAIPYHHIDEVVKLAQSNTLRLFGQIRGQQTNNMDVEFNYDMFLSRADELKDQVIEKWKKHTKPVVMRG